MSVRGISRRRFVAATSCAAASVYLSPAFGRAKVKPVKLPKAFLMDLSRSKYAKLRPFPLNDVKIGPGFWGTRVAINRSACLPAVYEEERENGRILNFERLHGTDPASLSPEVHSLRHGADSEVYKWLEGASWALTTPNPGEQQRVDQVIRAVVGAQEPSGYLDTWYVGSRVPTRMMPEEQIVGHEIYSMGHLLQAGIANYRTTGDRTLLDAGLRFVNDYLLPAWGPEAGKRPLFSGHGGPEMMLTELYRETGDVRYLELTGYLLRGDPRFPLRREDISYTFAGEPFVSRKALEGHAVRATYVCCGAADYALETGDPEYLRTLNVLWTDMTERQMYVTGAVGATIHNEAFAGDYELPNEGSYCESCANIGVAQWAQRMLALTGEARFGDVLERVLYNSVNSGMSLDGKGFNYRNPLLHHPGSDPRVRRPFWYVNCCPPNLARTFSSLQSTFYSASKDGIYVHLYDNSELAGELADGTPVALTQTTHYPWEGTIQIAVEPVRASEFTLYLRIPAWSQQSSAAVNGVPVELVEPGQYLAIRRTWAHGDKVNLSFDMTPRALTANPSIEADKRRIAVQRGPLVYCMEGLDQSPALSLDQFVLDIEGNGLRNVKELFEPGLFGGIVTLEADATLYPPPLRHAEHSSYTPLALPKEKPRPVRVRLIPYYTFANREETAMQVWLPYNEVIA